MSNLKEEYIEDLVPKTSSQSLIVRKNRLISTTFDAAREEQLKNYLKIRQLIDLWVIISKKIVEFVIWHEEDQDETLVDSTKKELLALIKEFDIEMIEFSGSSRTKDKLINSLENLQESVRAPTAGRNGRVRRNRIRRRTSKVTRYMRSLERQIVTPGALQRGLKSLWGHASIPMTEEQQAKLTSDVGSSLKKVSVAVASSIGVPTKVLEAAAVLGIPSWSTKHQMEEQFRYKLKSVHPDLGGNSEETDRLIKARNTIRDYHESLGKQSQ